MPEPCRSCDEREVDWGGCRCQALRLAGNAGLTDLACAKSSLHKQFLETAEREAALPAPPLAYRSTQAGRPL